MPVQPCTKNGKKGWKWGDEGACYTGDWGKRRALEQGKAIEASKARRNK